MKFVCPHCNQEVEIQTPEAVRRGALSGLSLEEMTDEQLKRELVNAKSVLYKAEKRGSSADIIAKNKDRVEAALAEKARRTPVAETAETEVLGDVQEAVLEEEVATEDVYETDNI